MQLHIPSHKFEIDVVQETCCLPDCLIIAKACVKRSHHSTGGGAMFFEPVYILVKENNRWERSMNKDMPPGIISMTTHPHGYAYNR